MAHICEEPDYKLTSKHIYNLQNTTYSSSRNALTWKVSATEENPGCQQSIQLEIDRDYLKNQSLSSSSFDKISSIAWAWGLTLSWRNSMAGENGMFKWWNTIDRSRFPWELSSFWTVWCIPGKAFQSTKAFLRSRLILTWWISKPHRWRRGTLQGPCCKAALMIALTSEANLFCRIEACPFLPPFLSPGRLGDCDDEKPWLPFKTRNRCLSGHTLCLEWPMVVSSKLLNMATISLNSTPKSKVAPNLDTQFDYGLFPSAW